jgi:hypothetical protein
MKKTIAALAGALALCGACKDSLNAPSQDAIVAGSPQSLQNLVTGVIALDRGQAVAFSYLLFPENEARNSLRIDPNEPRYISEFIAKPIDPTDFIGGSAWTGYYSGIRAANLLLISPAFTALSAGNQAATSGFVQTIKALQYIRLVQLHDSLGAVIQSPNTAVPDPFRTKGAVLAYVSALLDSANASLTGAGVSASVPFTLPSGFKSNGDYSKTANLALFNRGLKGMVEVYRGLDRGTPCATCFATAITALTTALSAVPAVPAASDLAGGPYYQFNPSAPESASNGLADNHIFLTDNFVNSILPGDLRASKIVLAAAKSSTVNGLQLTFRDPVTDAGNLNNLTRLDPIVRNAAFFLLRAQAEAATGLFAAATADVSAVTVGEGGNAPYALFTTAAQAQAAILYEYRYSFLYEGPYYLVAARQYSIINLAYVTQPGMPSLGSPLDLAHASDPLQTTLPIPAAEIAARGGGALTLVP